MFEKWEPPMVYDIKTDSRRRVTQHDVDRWADLEQAYGRMVRFLRAEHAAIVERYKRMDDDA